MKNYLPFIIFAVCLLAIDLYAFKSLKLVLSGLSKSLPRNLLFTGYWVISVGTYALVLYALVSYRDAQARMDYYFFFMGFGILLLFLIPKVVVALFHLLDDIVHVFKRLILFFSRQFEPADVQKPPGNAITRWQFITRTGWILAALPFLSILYGMAKGRYNFGIQTVRLSSPKLPESANGLRIVQISDIHIGSFFNNHSPVQRGIDLVNSLKPDLILFTGDMVNNYADELKGWEEVIGSLKAKYGKFSILGNHDYGDYVNWPSAEEKRKNLERLKDYHEKLGFRLLLNEWELFKTESGDNFEIIGVENWGEGGFSKYGNLSKAMEGTDPDRFQILLSHDPSHWDVEVKEKTQIDLTLSGHTHGMQFGVMIPGLVKWSPVKYRYPRWNGLYEVNKQYLYVNRGFGYIGFPGRVGMPPEITVFELQAGNTSEAIAMA